MLGWSLRGWILLLLAGTNLPVLSEEAAAPPASTATTESSIDWTAGRFYLTLRAAMVNTEATREMAAPKRRYLTEHTLGAKLEQAFVAEAGKIPVDSSRTLADLEAEDPAVTARLSALVPSLRFHYSRVDEAYTSLEMRWSASLWTDLLPLVSEVAEPNPLTRLISWSPSRDFSGLVIFAMGNLPWYGTNKLMAMWSPALTFRLLSPEGEVLFDLSMADPKALEEAGLAGLSLGKFNEEAWRDRIGNDPLRIVARGVFGKNPGDLILARDDWNKILARPANRDLLVGGKILILWGPFPDYTIKPNPDSVIDVNQPAIQVIPQPPVEKAAEPASSGH